MPRKNSAVAAILPHPRRQSRPGESETQPFGTVVETPIALSEVVCVASCDDLNQLLADTITLRDLYKKHHWQLAGPQFYSLHKLFDKHFETQSELVDELAERIQLLGGVSLAMAADVAETTLIPRPPKGREALPAQLTRLMRAHEIVLREARTMARLAEERADVGSNDLIVGHVIRRNEFQVWFIAQQAQQVPAAQAA